MSDNIFSIENYDIKSNYSIDASAGTGKTFSIEHIVEKIVLSGIDISKLLVVTYTEKAAGELKDRIRKILAESGKDANVDNATIGTIHSFCKSTIEEFPIETNSVAGLEVIDESLLDDYIIKYYRSKLYSNNLQTNDKEDVFSIKIKGILANLQFKENGKIDIDICGVGSDTFGFISDFHERCKALKNDKNGIINFLISKPNDIMIEEIIPYYEKLSTALKIALSCFKKELYFANDEYKPLYKKMYEEFLSSIFDSILSKYNFSYNCEEWYFKAVKIPEEVIKELNYFKTLFSSQDQEFESYISYAKEIYLILKEEKKKHKWQTFNDMISAVRNAIIKENSPLIDKLRKKYTYAIIDEFQDTNQMQWDIFKNVFLKSDEHKIIVVGDPKQSIYSFQGADVNVYKKAVEEIEESGGICQKLDTNFRSTVDVVNGYNNLFNLPFFNSLKYYNVNAATYDKEKHTEERKTLYKGQPYKGFIPVIIDNKASESYAKYIINMIIDFCTFNKNGKTNLQVSLTSKEKKELNTTEDYRNVTFKDIAILYRNRFDSIYLEKELKKVGMPFIKNKDNSLFLSKENDQWIALFEAIDAPDFTNSNRNIFRKALFSKFFMIELKDLSSPHFEKDNIPEMDLINKWRELAKKRQYEQLIDSILNDSGIEERMNSISDIHSLTCLREIGYFAMNYLLDNHTIKELIIKLKALKNKDETDSSSSTIPKGTDYNCVQLMTMHASKGLGFPVVIDAGIKQIDDMSKIINKNELVFKYYKDGKKYITFNSEVGKQEIIDEYKRLLYVAYTRPKNVLIIPSYIKELDLMSLLNVITLDSTDEISYKEEKEYKTKIEDILAHLKEKKINNNDDKDKQLKEIKKVISGCYFKSSYKHSYSSLSHNEENKDSIIDEELNPDKEGIEESDTLKEYDLNSIQIEANYNAFIEPLNLSDDFPKGAIIGTTLHEIFEHFEFTSLNYKDNNLLNIIKERFDANKIKEKEEWIKDCEKIVHNVLNASLPIIHGSQKIDGNILLSNIKKENRKAEIEFNFNVSYKNEKNEEVTINLSNFINGFIDLIFKNGEYYSILDWKSDKMNDEDLLSYSNAKHLKERVDNKYSIQRVLYSYCLIKWLKNFYQDKDESQIFNEHFGGIYYVFLRGCNDGYGNGIYAQSWSSWDDLKNAFNNIASIKIGGMKNGK